MLSAVSIFEPTDGPPYVVPRRDCKAAYAWVQYACVQHALAHSARAICGWSSCPTTIPSRRSTTRPACSASGSVTVARSLASARRWLPFVVASIGHSWARWSAARGASGWKPSSRSPTVSKLMPDASSADYQCHPESLPEHSNHSRPHPWRRQVSTSTSVALRRMMTLDKGPAGPSSVKMPPSRYPTSNQTAPPNAGGSAINAGRAHFWAACSRRAFQAKSAAMKTCCAISIPLGFARFVILL